MIASNIDVSVRFYERIGFSVLRREYRDSRESWKVDLALPSGAAIELFSFPKAPSRPSQPEACGLRHLAFEVEDLDATVTAAASAGVVLEPIRIDEATGSRFTFFADPDGLPLELYECRMQQL